MWSARGPPRRGGHNCGSIMCWLILFTDNFLVSASINRILLQPTDYTALYNISLQMLNSQLRHFTSYTCLQNVTRRMFFYNLYKYEPCKLFWYSNAWLVKHRQKNRHINFIICIYILSNFFGPYNYHANLSDPF